MNACSTPVPDHTADVDFDVIIIGTGLSECLLAGALAKAGQNVLHIDTAEYYGAEYAAFHSSEFMENQDDFSWLHIPDSPSSSPSSSPGTYPSVNSESEQHITKEDSVKEQHIALLQPILLNHPKATHYFEKLLGITNFSESHLRDMSPKQLAQAALLANILKGSHEFNIEQIPLLLYCRGPLVDLLVSSRAGPFLEFKLLEDMYLEWNGEMEKVPGSKEDVFSIKSTDLVGKRYLMKFLSFALDYKTNEELWHVYYSIDLDYRDKPFSEFLATQKLNPKMAGVIIHAIALVTNLHTSQNITTAEGLLLTHNHLSSLGRYGKGAFLMGIYGSGSELCQAFSRYTAVYGGTYILGFKLDNIVVGTDGVSVFGEGKQFNAKYLVIGASHASLLPIDTKVETSYSWRSTIITHSALIGEGTLALTILPPRAEGRSDGVFALQSNSTTKVCPDKFYTIALVSDSCSTTREDLQNTLEVLAKNYCRNHPDSDGFTSLQLFHHIKHTKVITQAGWVHDRVAVCQGPTLSVHAEHHVQEARTIFEKICPESPFYPEQPDPNLIDDD
ncbi:hypothetical protein BASA61_007194 [Batrachochytrium salamandrivorans]|nr:hypothetical protein BASA61_007194 [Batrachochytrium salamandrivorans]KAH9272175.1 hypothetical protein BASA83_005515 [Batrachochytrium salamandrivorans]